MVLPHFTGSGTPYLDLESKGAIVGLTLSTTKGELVKAILEGISYEIKQNLAMLQDAGVVINEVRAIGGGAKSEKWLQPQSRYVWEKGHRVGYIRRGLSRYRYPLGDRNRQV